MSTRHLIFDAPDGTYRIYDMVTGDFGCYTADGKVCTIFKLDHYKLSDEQRDTFFRLQGVMIEALPQAPPKNKNVQKFLGCHFCPICGFELRKHRPPYTSGTPSFDTCPCCRFEYGFHDLVKGESFESWRSRWIGAGARWPEDKIVAEPRGWDAAKQLLNIQVVLSISVAQLRNGEN